MAHHSHHPGYNWVDSHTGAPFPTNAVHGGVDSDGSSIYVGKASHKGNEVPCKVVPNRKAAYIGWDGREIPVSHYKVLCSYGGLHWVRSQGGNVPHSAVPGGRTTSGETLYVGRASHDNALIVGKIHPSYHCLFIPYGGKEHSYVDYEVLVTF